MTIMLAAPLILVLFQPPATGASLSPQKSVHAGHALVFAEARDVPPERTVLSDTATETWFFVAAWSDTRSSGAWRAQPPRTTGMRYRERSPFVVFDKTTRRWRTAAISHLAFEIYPVRQDPEDPSLIWFGCNDGRPNQIIDWAALQRAGGADDPLVFAGHPGGLGLIDTAARTVTYFGPFRDLVGGRVYELLFEKDAVWVWGRYHGASELNGLARFDRRSRTFEPLPIASHGFDDAWSLQRMTAANGTISLSVLEDREWFNRYELDTLRRQWRPVRYVWVSSADVPLFDRPDDSRSPVMVLRPGMHFGKQGHDHFGHPLVILEERSGWQRVLTCRDVAGWIRSGALVDTLRFFQLTLNSPAAREDRGNDGPRMFLARAHLYMTAAEVQDAIEMLRGTPDAAVFKDLLDREALGLGLAAQLWDAFNTRRASLR